MPTITEVRPWSRRLGVGLVVAGLVLSLMSKHSENLGFPISPDRPLIAAGVGLLLVTGHFGSGGRLRWRWAHTVMVAMVLWTLFSAITYGTLLTDYGFYAFADRLVLPFVLFALAPVIFRTEGDRKLLMQALVGMGLYLGLTAIFEVIGPSALVFPGYIADPLIGDAFGRARGPMLSAEANGMILAAALFASVVGLGRLQGAWRLAAMATAAVAPVGILLTLTRSVWLGSILGFLAIAFVTPALRRRLPLMIGGTVALLGAVLLAVPSVTRVVLERLTTERSVFDRANTNAAALRMFAENPIDGVGWVRSLQLSADWVRQADTYPITNVTIEVHNVLLSRAAELGAIGAALWLACVAAGPLLAVIHKPRDADLAGWRLVLIGYGCLWAITIMLSPVPYQLPNNLIFLLAGIVLKDHLVTPWRSAPDPVEPAGATVSSTPSVGPVRLAQDEPATP